MFQTNLSEEQILMVQTAQKLVKEHIIEPRVDMALDQSGEFPHQVLKTFWENGLMNVQIPTEFGGAGLSCLDHVLLQEEIHYGCLGIGTSLVGNSLAAMPVILSGNTFLQKKYLTALTSQPTYAAYACSEPDAGSDVAALSTRYSKKGSSYVINGLKRWITNGDVAQWYVVFAREEGTRGHQGIAAFIVDANCPGARAEGLVHKLGQRASHTCDLVFENATIPSENMLVGPENGFKLAMASFDSSRPWIACAASGVIRRARDESLKYAQERKTFGTPIIQHQMVQHMLANMEIGYQATRLLALHAAYTNDQGQLRGVHSACAKAFGADTAMQVTTDAVQIFGGYGYTQEYVVEKLMRDAKLLQIYEGTSQIQRMVIVRDLLRQN
jgi:acyl-CoA dehydrogenase